MAEFFVKCGLWYYQFNYTDLVQNTCEERLAQQQEKVIAYEAETGHKPAENKLETMESCTESYGDAMIAAALTVLFFRVWFSYTIYQWFMEIKETGNRVRDHSRVRPPEIER